MPALLPVILTATHLALTTQAVPHLNIEPSCRAAAEASARHDTRNVSVCLQDERRARAKLKRQWRTFTGAEQQRCVDLTRLGGPPSYVELLTCLQMAKDAKNLPDDGKMSSRLGR
jgi:hypothetical protein